jgi:hypothetical protein
MAKAKVIKAEAKLMAEEDTTNTTEGQKAWVWRSAMPSSYNMTRD